MAFTLSGSIATQTGRQQSQAITAISLTLTNSTGRITAAAAWLSTVVDGSAIVITSSTGVYKGALCVASVSSTNLTYYRLFEEDKTGELTPAIVVGDIVYVCENAEDVASGGAKLSAIAGVTAQVSGTGKSRSAVWAVGDLQLQFNGYFHVRSLDTIEYGNAASDTLSQFAAGTGTLVVGSYKTFNGVTVYSLGTNIKSARTGLLYYQSGSVGKLEWFGGAFVLQTGGITGGNIPYLRAYSQNCVLTSQTSETQFRYDGSYNWIVKGLTTTGFAGVNFIVGLSAFKRWRSRGSESFAVGLSNSTPVNTWIPITSPDFDGSNVGDLRGIGSRWYDITNPARSHRYTLYGSAMLARSSQDVRVKIVDPNGAAIKGKIWIKDSLNSGNRLAANVLQANPAFTADVTYAGEAVTGVFDATIVCMYFYATAGVPIEDYRFPPTTLPNGNITVSVPARVASYGYVFRELVFAPTGDSRYETESRMVLDSTITQRTAATVAAYTAIDTSAKAYDYDRWTRYSTFAGDITSPIDREGANLIFTGRTVVIDPSAAVPLTDSGTVITLKAAIYTGSITATNVTLLGGAQIVGTVYGDLIQATPSNLSGTNVTGTLIYNTATDTSITLTTCAIGTIRNDGTGIVTIMRDSVSTITTYTDAEINFLDSKLTAAGVTSVTIYPSQAERDAGMSPGPTFTSSVTFKYGATLSGVVMSGTVYVRVVVGSLTMLAQVTLAVGDNTLDLGINGQMQSIQSSVQSVAQAVALIPTKTVLVTDTRLDKLDAAISTRLASASYTAPDNSGIASIKSKTDNLPASPAAVGSAMTLTPAYDASKTAASQISVDGKPTLVQIEASTVLAKQATLTGIPAAVRANLATELANLDAKVSTRSTLTATDIPQGLTASQVWASPDRTLTDSDGLTDAQAEQLRKVAQLHGIGATLVVTASSRTAGDVSQVIDTAADQTIVRQA